MSQKYSIYEAKARLSEIIRTVKKKRRVIITDRGVPVAEVIPYQDDRKESLEDRITRLTSTGSLIPAKSKLRTDLIRVIPGAVDEFLKYDRD